jgi:hypothetical protein
MSDRPFRFIETAFFLQPVQTKIEKNAKFAASKYAAWKIEMGLN